MTLILVCSVSYLPAEKRYDVFLLLYNVLYQGFIVYFQFLFFSVLHVIYFCLTVLHFYTCQVSSVQLRDDLLSMLVAGHETTGSVLTWTLYLLSKVPFYFHSICFPSKMILLP